MKLHEIGKQRFYNHFLIYRQSLVIDILNGMGAMQAQDFSMSLWALGCRTNGATLSSITERFNKGEILRTHVMRPTWHLVSPEDIRWMLQLTSSQVKALTRSRDLQLGLDDKTIFNCIKVFEKHLEGNRHCTTDELKEIFAIEGIKTDENRLYHILMHAELNAVICSGAIKNKKQTYALLEERVPKVKKLTADESLYRLASKYFISHGPASLKDFAWWSGLSMSLVKKAIGQLSGILHETKVDGEIYYHINQINSPKNENIVLLPAFDELIISYKNRNAVLLPENQSKAFTSNGIFKPVVVIDGHGVGTWKRNVKRTEIEIEISLFDQWKHIEIDDFKKAANNYGNFMERKILYRLV